MIFWVRASEACDGFQRGINTPLGKPLAYDHGRSPRSENRFQYQPGLHGIHTSRPIFGSTNPSQPHVLTSKGSVSWAQAKIIGLIEGQQGKEILYGCPIRIFANENTREARG